MTDDDNIVLRGMNNFQTREGRNDDEDDVFMQLIADARPGRVKQKKRREDSCNIFATATLRATQLAGFACRSDREDDETYFFPEVGFFASLFFLFVSLAYYYNQCLPMATAKELAAAAARSRPSDVRIKEEEKKERFFNVVVGLAS